MNHIHTTIVGSNKKVCLFTSKIAAVLETTDKTTTVYTIGHDNEFVVNLSYDEVMTLISTWQAS